MSRLTPMKAAVATALLTLFPAFIWWQILTILRRPKPARQVRTPAPNATPALRIRDPAAWLLILRTLLTYTPGVRQQITVRVTPALNSYNSTGFQAAARLSNNTVAGHFETGHRTAVQVFNGQEYVNHALISSERSYSFFWTPPSTNVGNITIYIAAVAGPGDGLANALDDVYTTTYTLRPSTSSAPSGYQWTFPAVPERHHRRQQESAATALS